MDKLKTYKNELPISALNKWQPTLKAEVSSGYEIDILEVVGEDLWTGGITTQTVSKQLKEIGNNDVTVYINSPGGDMFEGIGIYNLLKEHKGKVTVKILGLAASAASIIAMAGDEIQIAKTGFLMIHNAWILAAGNKNDFLELASYLEPFDATMAQLYADKSGMSIAEITKMMDAETWINGTDAIDSGFADSYLGDKVIDDSSNSNAAAKLDVALAKAGVPRSERRKLLKEYKEGTQNAAEVTHNANQDLEDIKNMTAVLTSILQP